VIGVVLQPSYIPWRGVFDLIHRADVFVFYDDVQYDKHGWRNRNRVKTAQGTQWLTIPVNAKGNVTGKLLVKDVTIDVRQPWTKKHLGTLRQSYAKAPFFAEYFPRVEALYANAGASLCELDIAMTRALAGMLGIEKTRFVRSSELGIAGDRTERLVSILKALGCDHYISGPSAKAYIEPERFAEAGIGLEYIVYDYPEYEQLHPPYDPAVTVLDLLFMKGPAAPDFIWKR
jgi:hypothetical protein